MTQSVDTDTLLEKIDYVFILISIEDENHLKFCHSFQEYNFP